MSKAEAKRRRELVLKAIRIGRHATYNHETAKWMSKRDWIKEEKTFKGKRLRRRAKVMMRKQEFGD